MTPCDKRWFKLFANLTVLGRSGSETKKKTMTDVPPLLERASIHVEEVFGEGLVALVGQALHHKKGLNLGFEAENPIEADRRSTF